MDHICNRFSKGFLLNHVTCYHGVFINMCVCVCVCSLFTGKIWFRLCTRLSMPQQWDL